MSSQALLPLSAAITNEASSNKCMDTCGRLAKLTLNNGKLPTPDELVAQLAFNRNDQTEDELQEGLVLGTVHELRQRKTCPVCQLALAAIDEAQDEGSQSPTDEPVCLLLFPGEQSFRLSYPSRLGTRLAFVADEDSQISGPDSARLIEGTQVDPDKVLSWLKRCEDHRWSACYPQLNDKLRLAQVQGHSPPASLTAFMSSRHGRYDFNERATSNFRVIDLERECIVPEKLAARYVALSYVWGQLPMFRLLQDNIDELSREGGLRGVLGQLPRTILDAMEFTKSLGVRFLWVDALCLVQDDENDMEIGIEVMNSVYQGSYFTIIAASGIDATAGLPGVRPGSRCASQPVFDLDPSGNGLKMTVQHSIDWHLKRSVYNQRGWTLQELVLPRRAVIFVNSQVYFRCQEANWAEETTADTCTHHLDPDDSDISRIPDPMDGGVQSWWAYQKLLEEYSRREIRFDGDALRATAGLLRPLCAGMETVMLEGLPGHYLDNALLFISSRGDLRRRAAFPSFSWAGWAGAVMWPRENYVWYDNSGRRSWNAENLFRWFAGETFVNWSYISEDGQRGSLMGDPYKLPPRLGVLLDSFVGRYPQLTERLGGFEVPNQFGGFADRYCHSSGSGPFHENWSLERKRRTTSHAAFDLTNSQVEFDRMVRRIGSPGEVLFLFNWMACRPRRAYAQRGRDDASDSGDGGEPAPKSRGRPPDRVHYRFRRDHELSRPRKDRREENARNMIRPSARENADVPIPRFPPYAVLPFQTLSISLTLGEVPHVSEETPGPDRGPTSTFNRIPGIPLLSSSSKLVGSLHADNLQLLPAAGTSIECILMSHCQALTWNSALARDKVAVSSSDCEECTTEPALDLFWALYIVWKDGIAERRGVAQVVPDAVGDSCAPGPEIKDILLG